MTHQEFICPVTEKRLQPRFLAEDAAELAKRGEPLAVWCPYCERSHLIHRHDK